MDCLQSGSLTEPFMAEHARLQLRQLGTSTTGQHYQPVPSGTPLRLQIEILAGVTTRLMPSPGRSWLRMRACRSVSWAPLPPSRTTAQSPLLLSAVAACCPAASGPASLAEATEAASSP